MKKFYDYTDFGVNEYLFGSHVEILAIYKSAIRHNARVFGSIPLNTCTGVFGIEVVRDLFCGTMYTFLCPETCSEVLLHMVGGVLSR